MSIQPKTGGATNDLPPPTASKAENYEELTPEQKHDLETYMNDHEEYDYVEEFEI